MLGWSNRVPDVLTFVEQNGTANLRGVVLVDGFLDVSDPQMQKAREGMHISRCATGNAANQVTKGPPDGRKNLLLV
ncbi:MAG: hypothetical protein WBW01_14705 [Terriglobales bacterium]